MQILFETPNLIIRYFNQNDWKDLYEYLSDEEVIFYEPHDAFTEQEAKDEAIRRSNNPSFYAVVLKENNKVIGNLYFEKQDFGTWELGYVFNKKYQGKGLAFESSKALIDYGIKNLNVRRIIAMCNPENTRSWKLMERLQMRREGILLKNIYFKTDKNGNPLWQDTYMYGVLADELK